MLTVMNIVNFVRGSEPRYPDYDLVEPLREEIKLNTVRHLPNTILLQYDAMLRDDLVATAKTAERDQTEYGVWFEMCRQLVEACGIKWRGRKGWDWEWFVNPGFLMAYAPEERERILIDFGLTAELAWATAELRFRGAGEFFSKLDFPPGEIRMEFDGCRYGIRYEGDLKPSQNGWTLHPIRGRGIIDFNCD